MPNFIRVEAVADRRRVERFARELDLGKAVAITLMLEGRGDLLVIEERRGRLVAKREGVPVIGLLGVLTEAKNRGVLPSLGEMVERLQGVAGE